MLQAIISYSHGSDSWFYGLSCQDLYVNVHGLPIQQHKATTCNYDEGPLINKIRKIY